MTAALITMLLVGCYVPVPPESHEVAAARDLIDTGVTELRTGELERARAAFEVAREIADLPEALDGLGCVALLEGDFERAERYFRDALDRDPDYATALGNLALLYEARGAPSDGEEVYRLAIAKEPANVRLRNNLGVLIAGSSPRAAREEFLRAAALEPHPMIEHNLNALARDRRNP